MTTKAIHSDLSRGVWLAVAGGSVAASGILFLALRAPSRADTAPPPGMRYSPEGYGGYVVDRPVASSRPVASPESKVIAAPHVIASPAVASPELLRVARDAYLKGRYTEAEKVAAQVVTILPTKAAASMAVTTSVAKPAVKPIPAPTANANRKEVAEAHHLMAFAAARRKDYAVARERFAEAERAATSLPRPEPDPNRPEETLPTLAEDSAYQRAVCAAGMGNKAVAMREFIAFLNKYPESPLAHATMRRIARLNGGDIPKEAEAAWTTARDLASMGAKEQRRLRAFCGPDCLLELLRRSGKQAPDRDALAKELKTGEDGTTLAALETVAKRYGLTEARGVQMTGEGLLKALEESDQPVLALVQPQHYVLVEQITSEGTVTVWDPNGKAAGQPGKRIFFAAEWRRDWENFGGFALLLQ